MPDLTNNEYVQAFPLADNKEEYAALCSKLAFGTDGGPTDIYPWYPLGPISNMETGYYNYYDHGFGLGIQGFILFVFMKTVR